MWLQGARLQGDQLSEPAEQSETCQEHAHCLSVPAATLQCGRAQQEHPQQQSVIPHPPSVKQWGSLGRQRAARRDTLLGNKHPLVKALLPASRRTRFGMCRSQGQEPRHKVRSCSSAPVFHMEKLLRDAPVGLFTCCGCISQGHGSISAFALSDRTRRQWKPDTAQMLCICRTVPCSAFPEGFARTDPLSTVSAMQLPRWLISNHICSASDFRAFPKPPQLYGKSKPTSGALQDTDENALSSVPFLRATGAWHCSPIAAPSEQSSISKTCQVPTPRAAVWSMFLHTPREVHLHEVAAALCLKVPCIFNTESESFTGKGCWSGRCAG